MPPICFKVSSTTPTIMMMEVPPKDREDSEKIPVMKIGTTATMVKPMAPINTM